MKNRNRIQLLLLTLSVIIGGSVTGMCAKQLPVCAPAPLTQMAWWGGIYPEYSLTGAMEAVGAEEAGSEETMAPVRIRFKYLTFLNK